MGIVSYAQNFEDVLLWRALGHVENGRYIDIGAHDPVVDSVSKAFYERGWRGIHVEPLPVYCEALRRDRPDETVLQAAVAAETGVLRFYEIPDTGISTGDETIARSHREHGFPINEITVPCVTLAQVFELVQGDVVHWLKIDVEGLEAQVLQGWGESTLRPWVVVIESTLPLTQEEAFSSWEGFLFEKGYRCVHFDGLNRYYLAGGQSALENAFRSGPNVFDGFQLSGTANNPFCGHFAQRIRSEADDQIRSIEEQARLREIDESDCLERLGKAAENLESLRQELLAEQMGNLLNQNTAALALQTEQQARQEAEALLRHGMQREQEFTAQLFAAREELWLTQREYNIREQGLHERLKQAEINASQALTAHLQQALQRELVVAAQLQQVQEEAANFRSLYDERAQTWNLQEKSFLQEIEDLTHSVEQLRYANKLQAVQHGFTLEKYANERQHLIEAHEALLAQLQLDIVAGENANLQLQQRLVDVQRILDDTYASLSWRLTAPLRFIWTHIVGVVLEALPSASPPPEKSMSALGGVTLSVEGLGSSAGQHPLATHESPSANATIVFSEVNFNERTMTPILNVQDLLKLSGERFVRACYAKLLCREPDVEGLTHYSTRLQRGYGRMHVIADIANSEEARIMAVDLPGLRELLREQKIMSSWWRRLMTMPGRHEQSLNRVEELLDAMREDAQLTEQHLSSRLARLEAAMQTLQSQVGQAQEIGDSAQLAVEAVAPRCFQDHGQQSQLWLKRIQSVQERK